MRKAATDRRPRHVSGENVFDDIGFSPEEAQTLYVKAQLMSAILPEMRKKKYTQKQLTVVLDEHQPVISNLLRGKISAMSIEKLLRYAGRLGLSVRVETTRNGRKRTAA